MNDPRIPRRSTLWISDLSGEQTGAISSELFEVYHDERLDQSEVLRFEIPATSPKMALLAPDVGIRWQGRRFYVHEIEDNRDGTKATRSIEARALWYRLGDRFKVGSFLVSAQTPADGLAQILAGTGWTAGPATSTSVDQFTIEESDRSVLALLRLWAQVTGRFLVFNTAEMSVDLVDSRGRDLGTGFRYARNLKQIRRRVTPPAATVLHPFGAQDLTIAGVNGGTPFLEDFTYYTAQGLTIDEARERYTRTRVLSDPAFVDENALLAWGVAQLSTLAQAVISFECSVVDLSEITELPERFRVGDTVRVFDPEFGQDLRTTVVRLVEYPTQPWRNKIELAFILNPIGDGSSPSRPSTALAWEQFIQNNVSVQQPRNDLRYQIARLPLAFRPGGRANFHLDIFATGVGAGTLVVDVVEAISDVVQHRALEIPYVDGQLVHESAQWAYEDLDGEKDYRVRVQAFADGGPSVGAGVTIEADEMRFWILAQGAIRQTPVVANSIRYDFDGSTLLYQFQVPDGVTEITAEVSGGAGGYADGDQSAGAVVVALIPVAPGEILDVVPGDAGLPGDGTPPPPFVDGFGYPNGGAGDRPGLSLSGGGGGGGSSHVVRSGFPVADALVVAGAGGGANDGTGPSGNDQGGAGGMFAGGNGNVPRGGAGASQFAGGAGGTATADPGESGSFFQGGNAGESTSSFGYGGGGGGGGWYGGGGGCEETGGGSGGRGGSGGGGSSWVHPTDAVLVTATDGGNTGKGYVVLSWDDPA